MSSRRRPDRRRSSSRASASRTPAPAEPPARVEKPLVAVIRVVPAIKPGASRADIGRCTLSAEGCHLPDPRIHDRAPCGARPAAPPLGGGPVGCSEGELVAAFAAEARSALTLDASTVLEPASRARAARAGRGARGRDGALAGARRGTHGVRARRRARGAARGPQRPARAARVGGRRAPRRRARAPDRGRLDA